MIRIYCENCFPRDCAEEMEAGVSLKHPKIRYANYWLKTHYNGRFGKENSVKGQYYMEFKNPEDVLAFKLKFGW